MRIISSWNLVTVIDDINIYPTGPVIDSNAQLIQGKDGGFIYFTQFGIKRFIVNDKVFKDLGFSKDKIAIVEHYILQLFQDAEPLS